MVYAQDMEGEAERKRRAGSQEPGGILKGRGATGLALRGSQDMALETLPAQL